MRAEAPLSHEPLLKTMASAIADMQKQLGDLSTQVTRQAPPIPPPHHPQVPSPGAAIAPIPIPILQSAAHPLPPPPPQAPVAPLPNVAQLEDIFLSALGASSTSATLELVNGYWAATDYCLPNASGAKSPLSQAVLLTLLHRVRAFLPSTSHVC
jgi:hypothetical protein